MMEPARIVERQIWRDFGLGFGGRSIPEETAVALTYNGGTYAVMITTPQDLEDFAVGFSLSEGIIRSAAELDSLEVLHLGDGVELRIWLSGPKPIACGSDGGMLPGRRVADYVASIRSRKPCVRPPLSDPAGNFRRRRS